MARKKRQTITFWFFRLPVLCLAAVLIGCNLWIVCSTQDRVYERVSEIDSQPVGLVLGTSKKVGPDTPNQHFVNRLEAAAELFRSGKVTTLLVSGYRDSKYYDETRDMVADLVEMGVPESKIWADDQGARTFDSVERAYSVFGLDRFVIVSDDFHVSRALFIADQLGLEAVALRSEQVDPGYSRKVRVREYFARVKAVLDLYLIHSEERRERRLVQADQ